MICQKILAHWLAWCAMLAWGGDTLQPSAPPAGEKTVDVSQIAESLAVKQRTWKYASEPKSGADETNCVVFVSDVVEACLKASDSKLKMSSAVRSQIRIATVKPTEDLQELVTAGTDDRITGVQFALIQSKWGKAVTIADAKSGDLVQYWYKNNAGKWNGHSGVISQIQDGKVRLLGAHEKCLESEASLPYAKRNGGVGLSSQIDLSDKGAARGSEKKVFVARWTLPITKPAPP